MKKTMLMAAIAATGLLFAFNKANAQWVSSGTANTTVEYVNNDVGIGAFNSSTQPNSNLHLLEASPTINIQQTSSTSGTSALKFTGGANTYSFTTTSFPALGDGRFHIQNTSSGYNNAGIHFGGGQGMVFGTDLVSSATSFAQPFVFNGGVGIPTLAVSSTSTLVNSSGLFTIPSGNILGVNGGTFLGGNTTIGLSSALADLQVNGQVIVGYSGYPYNGLTVYGGTYLDCAVTIPGTNTFSVGGTSTLTGAVKINTSTIPTPVTTCNGTCNITSFNLAVGGNANISNSLVVGNNSDFTEGYPTGYSIYAEYGILTEKAKVAVKSTTNWADFVFDKSYKLRPLSELESFINKNHHLPEIPSAEEVVKDGLDVAQMDAKLLQKIEELTLYMIEMKKEINDLKKENAVLKTEINK